MEVEQGLFSLSTCLIDHKGRLRVLRKQICNHLLGFAGIWQWHVIHVCVWIEARRPEHLLQHRTESQKIREAACRILERSTISSWRKSQRRPCHTCGASIFAALPVSSSTPLSCCCALGCPASDVPPSRPELSVASPLVLLEGQCLGGTYGQRQLSVQPWLSSVSAIGIERR